MKNAYIFGRGDWKTIEEGNEREWLIGNGLGGYSGHSIIGGGYRMHHGYLVAATQVPVERSLILTRTQEQIKVGDRLYDLTSQEYVNEAKNGQEYLQRFVFDGIPEYRYQVEDITLTKSVAMEYGHNTVVVCYEIQNGSEASRLNLVPLFNFRGAGAVSERSDLAFGVSLEGNTLTLIPEKKESVRIRFMASEGQFYDRSLIPASMADPNFTVEENHYYRFDHRNGFRGLDNHYTPYEVHVDLQPFEQKRMYVICSTEELPSADGFAIAEDYKRRMQGLVDLAGYGDSFADRLVQAADHFIVNRESTGLKTILAGFPWFTDWGRDTMIAFQGLTLATKRFDDAKEILESFSRYVHNGLIPNMFPDTNSSPLYNTVDASLWYFHAVDQYLRYTNDHDFIRETIYPKLQEIVSAYRQGTDFSIGMDEDGLIHAGGGFDQVTWMDVRVGDWVVTPRHGKPVEINALWYNALCVMEALAGQYGDDPAPYGTLAAKVKESFNQRFWNEQAGCLLDVVDPNEDHIRPNQIWAVSLPYTMLSRDKERQIVQTVYKHLYGTYGLRSLSFADPGYQPKYIGKLIKRDGAYHMGTVWTFPLGGFITAYCKVNDYSPEAVRRARELCEVFDDHLRDGCINGIAEIFDGDFSSYSRGCYTQAWSVGEILRAYVEDVLPYEQGGTAQ